MRSLASAATGGGDRQGYGERLSDQTKELTALGQKMAEQGAELDRAKRQPGFQESFLTTPSDAARTHIPDLSTPAKMRPPASESENRIHGAKKIGQRSILRLFQTELATSRHFDFPCHLLTYCVAFPPNTQGVKRKGFRPTAQHSTKKRAPRFKGARHVNAQTSPRGVSPWLRRSLLSRRRG